ncbi:uncharacterized protein DFL_000405 [Arthrobotrys flagrans]|uniref:Uncharacterized protein n=1 Tax=Arthrobotrys flagrans TaxID=97331 RepID=A0A437ADU8_ARTFL|nr:hypothetical protein DFL_000405 [Arthrobotrys flagrans]
MCHKIYTFSKCYHIDVSDDVKHFPPCNCRRVRATHQLPRACNACIRFFSPAFPFEHKKAIEKQASRFKSLQLNHDEIRKYLPNWKKIVGVGTKILSDWPDGGRGSFYDGILDEKIFDAIEEEIVTLDDGSAAQNTVLTD